MYKRRVPLKLHEANEVLERSFKSDNISEYIVEADVNNTEYAVFDTFSNRQMMHEIEYMLKHYKLHPDTYIAYDRIALFGIDEPDLRITFDQNVRGRTDNLNLSAGDYGDYVLKDDKYLMEIKKSC